MKSRLLARLLVAIALLAPAAATAQSARPAAAAQTPPNDSAKAARLARADAGRIRGSTGVWIVVISDFQCPFCKRWHDESAARIEAEYVRTGKARIAYMNYPIASIHPNAYATHELAMCSSEQGKFFPVAEALFRTQDTWKTSRDIHAWLDTLARALPLDQPRLHACLRSGEMRALIDADIDRSTRRGAGSTPYFVIGGRAIIGAQPYEAFKQAIDAAIAASAAPRGR